MRSPKWFFLLALGALCLTALPASTAAKFRTYAPLITGSAAGARVRKTCDLSAQEVQLLSLAESHPQQRRLTLTCSPTLAAVARARALDMGRRDYFSHVNPDGLGPNYLVRQAGYDLPAWWPSDPRANNIESIGGGYATAQKAWQAWLNSSMHEKHVLGLDDFWARQTNIGIGYAYVEDSEFKHYWVFISAPPQG